MFGHSAHESVITGKALSNDAVAVVKRGVVRDQLVAHLAEGLILARSCIVAGRLFKENEGLSETKLFDREQVSVPRPL